MGHRGADDLAGRHGPRPSSGVILTPQKSSEHAEPPPTPGVRWEAQRHTALCGALGSECAGCFDRPESIWRSEVPDGGIRR